MKVGRGVDALEWWRSNRTSFPGVAGVARKWLSATATSTPAKRAFSDCGNVDTPKRNKLLADAISNQVMVKRNLDELGISLQDL